MKISVVIPLFKCSKSLFELNERLHKSMIDVTHDYELIYIVDGSPENEWDFVSQFCSINPNVKGLYLSRNFGQHYAISAGLKHVSGDWIVVMDGDLQDVPEEIGKLFLKANEGYEIVLAQRQERKDKFMKRLMSKIFYKLLSYLTGIEYDYKVSNFGIYHRKVIDAILSMGDNILFFPSMVKWVGFKKASVFVEHFKRRESKSSYNFVKLLKLAMDIILSNSEKPIRIVINAGLIISSIAFLIAIYTFIKALDNKIMVPGYASIIISIWFLSGMIISIIGVVGLYVSKTFQTVKRRPIFIVSEKINI